MAIGIDTNVLVRFLVRDDEQQFRRARALIVREARAGSPVLIALCVLLETEWVLRSRYRIGKDDMLSAMTLLLETADVRIEDDAVLEEALHGWRDADCEFADCLIAARYRRLGCLATATFDAKALATPGFVTP